MKMFPALSLSVASPFSVSLKKWLVAGVVTISSLCWSKHSAIAAEGREWIRMETGTSADFSGRTSLAAYSSNFVVAGGTDQTVLIYDGTEWKPFPSLESAYTNDDYNYRLQLGGVAVASPSRVFLAHYGDSRGSTSTSRAFMRYNSGSWTNNIRPSGSWARMTSVWAAPEREQVLVGVLGEGLYTSAAGGAAGWSRVLSEAVTINQIKHISNSGIYALAVASQEIYFSTDGGDTFAGKISGLPTAAYAFAPIADDSIWLVGEAGGIWHWDGSGFLQHTSPTSNNLLNVFAFSANDVWAVGAEKTLLHFDGTSWSQQALDHISGSYSFYDIKGDPQGNLYIAGTNGVILYARAIPEPGTAALVIPAMAFLFGGQRLLSLKKGAR